MSLLPVGLGAGDASYEIEKSLRFRASASAYLSRTPGTAGSRTTWTYSVWFKRARTGANDCLLMAGPSTNDFVYIDLSSSNRVRYQVQKSNGLRLNLQSTALLVDHSAWYHFIFVFDSSNATQSERARMFMNGERITSFSTNTNALLASDTAEVNNTSLHRIASSVLSVGDLVDGHLAEINLIDGQALAPSSFGEFDSNGVWVAKKYSGTYGTNGFYLPFNDGTNLTELTKDRSGNTNNWTATNVSLTAGATYDWMDDTPTNNFCTLNPLSLFSSITDAALIRNAGLTLIGNVTNFGGQCGGTVAVNSGKYYWEQTFATLTTSSGYLCAGFQDSSVNISGLTGTTRPLANTWWISDDGNVRANGGSITASGLGTFSAGDIAMIAVDVTTGKAWVGRNGTWVGNPSAGTGNTFSSIPASITPFGFVSRLSATETVLNSNFGQRPFAYTPPTGFLPLSTENTGAIAPISSGSFTGNALNNGPFVWLAGTPNSMTINGNAVTWGTHADRLANGIKLRTNSSSYNASGSNTFSVASFVDKFTDPNRAKGNP
jgi:hypothetical protein